MVQAKLGLVGATLNAMALIAPGAFLWITYQLQAAATAPSGAVGGKRHMAWGLSSRWSSAFSRPCPTRSSRRFTRKQVLPVAPISRRRPGSTPRGRKEAAPSRLARISKLATGWSAHLFYWAYSGVMAAMMATLIGYIYNQFTGQTSQSSIWPSSAWCSPL